MTARPGLGKDCQRVDCVGRSDLRESHSPSLPELASCVWSTNTPEGASR